MTADELRLPSAPPGSYLRWIAFWREIESSLLPQRDTDAARVLFSGEDARLFADIARRIADQAEDARRAGVATLSPVVRLPETEDRVAAVTALAKAFARRRKWLDSHGLPAEVAPLQNDLIDLRDLVLSTLVETAYRYAFEASQHDGQVTDQPD